MLKPKAVLKAYGADAQDDGQMEKEIFLELEELKVLLDFPYQISEQLPLPLYNNLLREDEPTKTEWEEGEI